MIKLATSLLFAIVFATPLAHALPVMTFDGVAYGANVADFYNGGTDSAGYSGANYGVHFNAVVGNTVAGAYVKGAATMTFAANLFGDNVPFYIQFNASRYDVDGANSFIRGGTSGGSVWVGGNGNPRCNTEAACIALGTGYVYHSTMGGYYFYSDGTATSVTFNTDRLDNVRFVLASEINGNPRPPSLIGSAVLDREIPEPATFALLGIGAALLMLTRRKKPAST